MDLETNNSQNMQPIWACTCTARSCRILLGVDDFQVEGGRHFVISLRAKRARNGKFHRICQSQTAHVDEHVSNYRDLRRCELLTVKVDLQGRTLKSLMRSDAKINKMPWCNNPLMN